LSLASCEKENGNGIQIPFASYREKENGKHFDVVEQDSSTCFDSYFYSFDASAETISGSLNNEASPHHIFLVDSFPS